MTRNSKSGQTHVETLQTIVKELINSWPMFSMAAWQAIQKFSRFEKAANLSLWNIHAFSSKGQMRTLAHNLLREYVSSVGLDSDDRRWMKKLNVQSRKVSFPTKN